MNKAKNSDQAWPRGCSGEVDHHWNDGKRPRRRGAAAIHRSR